MSKIYSPHHHRPNSPPNVLVSSVHPNDGGDQPAIWGYYDLELLSSSTSFLVKFQCLFNDETIMRRPPWVHAYIRMSCLSRWGRLFSRMAMVMSMGGWWCRRVNIVIHFTGTCWLSVALIHIRTDDIGQLRLTLSTVSLPRVVVLVPQWQFLRG